MAYQEPEVSGARYFKDTCGGFGAPEVAYYPYHHIFLSVAVVDGYNPVIGLHVPPGVTASLDYDHLKIVGHTTCGDFAVEGVLRAVPHGSFGNWLQHSGPSVAARPIPFFHRAGPPPGRRNAFGRILLVFVCCVSIAKFSALSGTAC